MLKRLVVNLLSATTLLTGSSKSTVLTPAEFTQEYVKHLQKARAGLIVETVQDLELRIAREGKPEVKHFLHNAYDVYKQDPSEKATVIKRFTLSFLESIDLQDQKLDPTRIIPVVKDRAWIEETRQAIVGQGEGKAPEHLIEGINNDLVILYAEDSEKNIRYLSPGDLAEAGIDTSELHDLACQNLKRLLPEIKLHGEDGFYMLTAGGNFEASLLLLDFVWKDSSLKVNGELVVAIPSRDLLMISGSENPAGIARLRNVIANVFSENGAYRLTQKLFVYRDGKIEEFEDPSGQAPVAR